MANGKGNVHLTSLDDLFTTQEQRDDAQREKVIDVPLHEIHDFPDHPFRVVQDDAMNEMAESVRQFGVLVPAMVRPRVDGGYELISGHRRKMASTLAGRETLPCIVRNLTDDEAIIVMVDSNLQREQLLPSEKAKAYKMKMDAMRRQAGRPRKENMSQIETNLQGSENCVQVGPNFERKRSRELLAENSPDSNTQIQRFLRLNNLVPEILSLVDEGKIGMTPAVELSYLKPEEQAMLADTIDCEEATPSLSQAQRMRKMSAAGDLDDDSMLEIMKEQKKPPLTTGPKKPSQESQGLLIPTDTLRKYFPKGYNLDNLQALVLKFLESWAREKDRKAAQAQQQASGDRAQKKHSGPER